MTKQDVKTVVDDLRNGVYYENVSIEPLFGCALKDFPFRKYVRKEVIVNHLRYQCLFLNGGIDEVELDNCLFILKNKQVIMV